MLSPNGGEKYEVGDAIPIEVHSWGLLSTQSILQLNTGNAGAVGSWQANAFQTEVYSYFTDSSSIDLTGVTNPAPEAVYQSGVTSATHF